MANEEKVWKFLIEHGLTEAGAAGMMGNMQAESGIISNRVEIVCLKRLKESGKNYNDSTYTAAVDNGVITREAFLNPFPNSQYGYGLCQWTFPSRKGNLYDFCKKKKKSIGDLNTQLLFLIKELKASYGSVWKILTTSTSVSTCSDSVLIDFEKPANAENQKAKRRQYSNSWYKKFKKPDDKDAADVVKLAQECIGLKESDGSFKKIIDEYNKLKPLPRGYKMSYTDPWCAVFVSYISKVLNLTSIIPVECGCPEMIDLFKELGEWEEDDKHCPQPGEIIFYDWQDGDDYKKTNNLGLTDHVGIVETVGNSQFYVIEGNKSDAVARRKMDLNGRYIRGFGIPKYSKKTNTGNVESKLYRVQAASFKTEARAKALCELLASVKIDSFYYKKDGWWLVQAGAFTKKSNAEKRLAELKEKASVSGLIW